jgi:CheY-like chemotaxis protein/anti-sigma regulatory factor (Ser/Thr protein kinase)
VSDACASKGLTYSVEMAPVVQTLRMGDAQRLAQVLLNLVGNAVKFTESGHVRVSVQSVSGGLSAEHLRFEVEDTGMGLDLPLQATVFDGFVQGDNELTRVHGGTGLGLAICKRLVTQMDGEVGLVSELGSGATFWFTARLPVQPAGARAGDAGPQAWQAEQSVQGAHVLLAEDNESMRGILKQLLEMAGARVTLAENGQVAIQRVEETRFDLVLMDMQMPVMGGLEATVKIRQMPPFRDLPIVAMTANAMLGDREMCLEAGMNDYLSKPILAKDLEEKLHQLFAHPVRPGATQR